MKLLALMLIVLVSTTALEAKGLTRLYQRGSDIMEFLKLLGLDQRQDHLPDMLSGGEIQRVAIARALIDSPEILLADWPTGNLDTKRSAEIVRILKGLSREAGVTVTMVSHNLGLAAQADPKFEMRDGEIRTCAMAKQ